MPAQTTTNRNSSEAAPVRRSEEEYLNVGPEEDPDAINLEGIPEEATGTADGAEEKREEAEETEHASEEEEREKELEQEQK